MFEYEMMNVTTKEQIFAYAYGWKDLQGKRPELFNGEWICLQAEYID